jgi:energy-coupling factor transport system ATP-binding protein
MSEKLQLVNLNLFYQKQKVCGPVDADFNSGRINLIVGRAGSGKSTLLKTLAGFHKQFNGDILFNDSAFNPSGNIALAFQNPENLFFNPTVGQEVCYALYQTGFKGDVEETGKNWLNKWGLDHEKFWHKHPLELSGGEKRKVALCACTVLLPEVIMLDEPLAGLDYQGQLMLIKILQEIAKNHIVLVVTHDPELMLNIAANILFLKETGPGNFDANHFIRHALKDDNFYPLPKWYRQALKNVELPDDKAYPAVNAEAVYSFIKGFSDDD